MDVFVAGAGPAGCSAALAAARAGVSVLVADAKRELGLPVRCAEFVPRLVAREVDVPDEAVAQTVEEMVVFAEDEAEAGDQRIELGRIRSPGFILHRERFEQNLAKLAVEAGAELLLETRATLRENAVVELADREGTTSVRPEVVVAADGPFSAFRRGDEGATCLPAVQFTLRLARPMSCTEVHFARRFRFGYAWLFPKGDVANAGLGCMPAGGKRELIALLETFVKELRREGKVVSTPPLRRTAGWIPVWGPPGSAVRVADRGGVLFAGDAGGFADPVTGAGIWPAIATGSFAGRLAAEAAREDDPSLLAAYDDRWRELFGRALVRSADARRKMESEWDLWDIAELAREAWPGL